MSEQQVDKPVATTVTVSESEVFANYVNKPRVSATA